MPNALWYEQEPYSDVTEEPQQPQQGGANVPAYVSGLF